VARELYEILGIERGATVRQIKTAYRRMAREYHPDRNSATDAADRFKEAAEAYAVLSDPARRGLYDRWGLEAVRRPTATNAASGANWGEDEAFE
jgi:molecular chaperone DnaJ